jgi:hypothetical protein
MSDTFSALYEREVANAFNEELVGQLARISV